MATIKGTEIRIEVDTRSFKEVMKTLQQNPAIVNILEKCASDKWKAMVFGKFPSTPYAREVAKKAEQEKEHQEYMKWVIKERDAMWHRAYSLCSPHRSIVTGHYHSFTSDNLYSRERWVPEELESIPVDDDSVFSPRPAYVELEENA